MSCLPDCISIASANPFYDREGRYPASRIAIGCRVASDGDEVEPREPKPSRREANPPACLRRWGHELTDSIEDDLELRIVPLLERNELAGQVGASSEDCAQPDECPHDLDADLNGSRALEN